MKPLILVLLSVATLEAQSPGTITPMTAPKIAEFARQERVRRSQQPETAGRVYTSEEVRRMAIPGSTPAPPPVAAPTTVSVPTPPKAAAIDPKEAAEKIAAQRVKVQELMDRQSALQLQVAQFTDQYLAPVTDSNSQQKALASLMDTQKKLDDTGKELSTAQAKLRELEAQAQPKK